MPHLTRTAVARRSLAASVAGLLTSALVAATPLTAAALPTPSAAEQVKGPQVGDRGAADRLAANPALSVPGFDVDAFQHPTDQKPAVLWFWNRTQTDAQVDETLQDMHDAGFTETVIFRMDAEQFFSAAWFDRVEHTLRKAQELGMKVWLDNDSQFPSGAAGGLVVNGGTVGGTTYEPHPELEFKTAVRSGSSVVRGGRSVDLSGLFGSSITVEGGEVVADASVFPGITLLKDGAGWSDYTTDAHFTIGAGTAGFMVRSPDDKNGYLVDVRKAGNIDFWKQTNGGFQQLRLGGDIRPTWDPAAKHSISITADGPNLSVTLDGVAEPVLTDATFATGRVGMRVDGPQRWRLDDLAVTEAPGGASLYTNDFTDGASVNDFDVKVTPLENVIALAARPATGPGATDLDQVVDLSDEYAGDGTWEAPAGDWRVEAFTYRYRGDGYADSLDVEAMRLYDDIIMGEYYDRFPWAFGTVLQGFADDEPSLSDRPNGDAVPWTPTLAARLEAGGASVAKSMVSVFTDMGRKGTTEKSHFYRAASDQWVDAYWKPKYEWTEAHGVKIISNPLWDEHGPLEELRHSGNLLISHQWAQIPGTDLIFNDVGNGAARFLPRSAASVAHQLGRPLVYDELMGATGWERTLDDLRQGAAISALRGINKALYHTTYDAIDGIPYPPVFMKENTWWPWMNEVNDWTGRLMEFGRHTTAAPTALLQMQRSNEGAQRSSYGFDPDRDWIATMSSLEDSQVDFDQLDEGALTGDPQILAPAEVVDGTLHVGEMTYSTVVVPRAPYLSLEAATTLRDLVADGGEVVFAGPVPAMEIEGRDAALATMLAQVDSLGGSRVVHVGGPAQAGTATAGLGQAGVTLSPASTGVRVLRFSQSGTDGYLLLNEGGSTVDVDVTFPSTGTPAVWDPETGDVTEATTYSSDGGGVTVPMTLDPRAPLGVTISGAGGPAPAHATRVVGAGTVSSSDVVDGALVAQVTTERDGVTVVRGTGSTGTLTGATAPVDVPDQVSLGGAWTLALENGSAPLSRPLGSWTDVAPNYSGSGTYTTDVTLGADQLTDTGWTLDLGKVGDVAEITVNGTPVGDRIWAPYTIDVGSALRVGTNTISVRVTNTQGNEKNRQPYTSGLVGPVSLVPSLTLPVTLTAATITATGAVAAMDADGRGADAALTVRNDGDAAVTGVVRATGPDGWTSRASAPVTVAPGESATGTARVFPGGFVPDGDVPLDLTFVVDGAPVDGRTATLDASFATPPTGATDHVDLGDSASEAAHGLTASATSGTNVEAGLTRRYGGYRIPDAYYEFDLAVADRRGFVLQGLETYDDNPQQKSYKIFVDGTLVATRLNVRPLRRAGTAAYRLHVPARFVATGADGTVRVRLQSRTDPDFADPSLADVWALPFQGDTTAPEVTVEQSATVPGSAGWARGPVTVTLETTDDQDADPVVEWGTDAGWTSYDGPFTIGTEGTTTVSYRARDAAGNSTGVSATDVRIDTVAPLTAAAARVRPGVANADRATVTLSATDVTSGVAATSYRLDGGDWVTGAGPFEVTGFGSHTVDFASTDVAGNTEPTHSVTIDLRDVDAVSAVLVPQVTGTAVVGSTLTATTGTWNTPGLDFAFQWLRNGSPVAGATRSSYRVGAADVGKRVSVRVTASKTGLEPGVAESAASAPVKKASSSAKVEVNKTRLKRKQSLKVTARVSSSLRATGKVLVELDGRTVKKASLNKHGKASTRIRIGKRGKHEVQVDLPGLAHRVRLPVGPGDRQGPLTRQSSAGPSQPPTGRTGGAPRTPSGVQDGEVDTGTPTAGWLREQRRLLTGLAVASRHPTGGFGWLDEAGGIVLERSVETWISCRMTHVLALAQVYDDAGTGDHVEHGVAALASGGVLHDDRHGGWFAAADPDGPHGTTKRAYEHAFVLLAASSALAAGHESARPVLDEALDVLERRFFDPSVGLYLDVLDGSWAGAEPYLGANATMHLVEALLTAHDVGAGAGTLDRALALAHRIVHEIAAGAGFRLPEHYDAAGRAMLDYNRDDPGHPFRPYGVTIGHLLEWARLLVHLHHACLGAGREAPAWLLPDAESLFARAVADGWEVDGTEGFVYTVDFDGVPVVRQRLHWVVAEAINAAQVLADLRPEGGYDDWRRRWWRHARASFVDVDGSWRHELDPDLGAATSIWPGRPDVYHAYQAVLLPRVGRAGLVRCRGGRVRGRAPRPDARPTRRPWRRRVSGSTGSDDRGHLPVGVLVTGSAIALHGADARGPRPRRRRWAGSGRARPGGTRPSRPAGTSGPGSGPSARRRRRTRRRRRARSPST